MTRELVLLLTDVVDSTQLNDERGDADMAPAWAAHDLAARKLLRRYRGTEVGRSDGLLAVFDDAADAAAFAVGYHQTLKALPVPMRARVGIHRGPVTLRANSPQDVAQGATPFEIDGIALPTAARVMSAAVGGQTLLSAAVDRRLAGTRWRRASHGHWRLKGLSAPIELFELADDDATPTPPPDSPKAYRVIEAFGHWQPVRELPNSLPADRDPFIGREEALAAIDRQLASGRRLLTIVGAGGIGKTRLALRYARSWLGNFPGGAWFCDLSSARDLNGLTNAVAAGLGVPLGLAAPVPRIGAALAGRGGCLIILDNFEQLIGHAEETVGQWLARAPEAAFIATSREVLGIVGEQVMNLEPMTMVEAEALFRQRLDAAGAPRRVDAADGRAIESLMLMLDCLPLAIELAAARGRLLRPSELVERMSDRFDILSGRGARDDRQATLRATLDWSWDLLSAAERSALAQLSVFEGGFTLRAAEAVLDLSAHRQAPASVNVVQALVEKSLVRQPDPTRRLAILQSIREYAAQHRARFDGPPGDGMRVVAAATRHATYFAGSHRGRSNAELAPDLENLVAATRWAAAAGDGAVAIGALEGAWRALKLRGPYGLLLELVERVQATDGLAADARMRLDAVAGWALKAIGRGAEARPYLERALSAAQTVGDRRRESEVASDLGEVHSNAGRVAEAIRAFEWALAAAEQTGIEALKWPVLTGLGNLSWRRGDLDQALHHHRGALEVARRVGDRQWEGGSLGNLGVMQANLGRTSDAQTSYRQALAISRELGDRTFEGNTLCNLGLLQHVQGDHGQATSSLRAALTVARELGHRRLEGVVHCNLGLALEALLLAQEARGHYESALRIARDMQDRTAQGQVLSYLGALHARQGQLEDARGCLDEAGELLRGGPDKLSLAMLLCAQAEYEHRSGRPEPARDALADARSLAAEIGSAAGAELHQAIDRVTRLLPSG